MMQDTLPKAQESTNKNISMTMTMNKKVKNQEKRNWVIIEDYPSKAEYLIAYILEHFPDDEIHLLYGEKETTNVPIYINLKGEKNPKEFKMRLMFFPKRQFKTVEGDVHYYQCHTEELFLENFQKILPLEKAILLLDVELSALGNRRGFESILKYQAKDFLTLKEKKTTITITTAQMAFGTVKGAIDRDDDRILALGGKWQFVGSTMNEDCKSVVFEADKHWKKLHGIPVFTVSDFFEKMAPFNQHACHNWQEEVAGNLLKYKQKGRWNEEWNMPIQLSYLIRLLNYDPEDFIRDLDLKDERGFFRDGCAICECLKVMGTKDSNTLSFSIVGALLFCWAAYRDVFPEGKHNHHFITAIKSCDKEAARKSFITPPQSIESQKETAIALYEMIRVLCYSTEKNTLGSDLIKAVLITKNALEIRINIDPKMLLASIQKEYKKRCGEGGVGGGTSTKKIMNYFAASNKCDRLIWNKYSILGNSNRGFSILTAGEHEINGIILKFGYEPSH